MKKYICEFIGTFVLVLFGCGIAVVSGGDLVATALAFGLAIVACAYVIGGVSGCHVNPAVSLAMLIRGDIGIKDDEAVVSDIRFIKTRSAGGTCIGMNLYMEEPHSVHLKINVRIGIARKDVKPVLFVYKEEDLNG